MSRILIVEDQQSICWGLSRLVSSMGHDAAVASSAEDGLREAAVRRPELIVLDVRLPGVDGITAMQQFRTVVGDAPIVIITAFGDLDTAINAVRHGAFEYVVKPFALAEIRAAIERALSAAPTAPADGELHAGVEGMLGRTPVMQEVFKRIALAAHSDAVVLLSGESGVGKELAARAIHRHSPRGDGPFVAVNVAALNPTLAEAELFGHTENAFTGAGGPRKGLLAHADGGTLFLDEVADIPVPTQVKLLRALDRGEVLPVGSDEPVTTRFRIISATHQDLQQWVRRGKFRHDLFYRLGAFEIAMPPLRERQEDIPLLTAHFASQLNGNANFSEAALAELQLRHWHGNVRELRNAVEHALVMARSGVVLPSHLPSPVTNCGTAERESVRSDLRAVVAQRAEELLRDAAAKGSVYQRLLEDVEPPLLAAAVERHQQQFAPAARVLGLHRTTLKRKLDHYGLSERHPRSL